MLWLNLSVFLGFLKVEVFCFYSWLVVFLVFFVRCSFVSVYLMLVWYMLLGCWIDCVS